MIHSAVPIWVVVIFVIACIAAIIGIVRSF